VGKWRQACLPSLPATAAHERSSCESCIYKESMQYIGLHCTSLAIYKKHEPCIFWDRNSVVFIHKPSRQQLVISKPMTRCPPPQNLQEKKKQTFFFASLLGYAKETKSWRWISPKSTSISSNQYYSLNLIESTHFEREAWTLCFTTLNLAYQGEHIHTKMTQ